MIEEIGMTVDEFEGRMISAIKRCKYLTKARKQKIIRGRSALVETCYARASETAQMYFDLGVINDGHNVLDVGCGHGLMAAPLLQHGCEYIGLEVSKPCCARAKYVFKGVDSVKFYHLNVQSDKYTNPDGSLRENDVLFPVDAEWADCVIARSLFTHFKTLLGVFHYLSEVNRCLKIGGRLYVIFFRSPPNELTTSVDRRVFTENEILTALHSSGLVVDKNWDGETTERDDQWRFVCRKEE